MNTGTNYGRLQTSIELAKGELWKKPKDFNPLEDINDISKDNEYFGRNHTKENSPPVYLPSYAINHILLCGITRSGKGVMATIKGVEAIKKRRGLFYIDVKHEDFAPQAFLEELERQNRKDDFIMVVWPNDFRYDAINPDDTIYEFFEKAIVLFNIGRSDADDVGYYRKVERMTLFRVIELGFKTHFTDWYSLLEFLRNLYEDFEARTEYIKERSKTNFDVEKLEKLSERYFENDFLSAFNFSAPNIQALNSLYITLFEALSGASVRHAIDIGDALYNGKVVYIKADMLSMQSLQFLKIFFIDVLQRARKKKANALIIADEISFYATPALSAQLSVAAGFGLQYILQLQDLAQIPDEIRAPILTNCSVKLYYKISDTKTLNEVEILGGVEPVTIYNTNLNDRTERISIATEPLLNATRVRAMWFQRVAILIAEYWYTSSFIQTSPVPVREKYDWTKHSDFVEPPKSNRQKKKFSNSNNQTRHQDIETPSAGSEKLGIANF